MIKRRKKKKESGQAVVEFAIVLPLFLLLVMGIIDFGWFFYNYTVFENSARNGARFACVEYTELGYDEVTKTLAANNVYSITKDANGAFVAADDLENTDEEDIIAAVCKTLPTSARDVKVYVTYSYDNKMRNDNDMEHYIVTDRSTGDVTVTVTGKIKVLTPVLGITADHMMKDINTQSTFKVEKQYIPTDDD